MIDVKGILECVRSLPLKEMAEEPYERKGIIHSEIAFIIGACKFYGIETILESGRWRGQSTYMLWKYSDMEIWSVDNGALAGGNEATKFAKERLKDTGVHLIDGDGLKVLPELRKDKANVAAIIDGPKHELALGLLKKLNCPGFIHDMWNKGPGSGGRQSWSKFFKEGFFTDDKDYVEEFGWLDKSIADLDDQWYPYHFRKPWKDEKYRKIESYAGTIGHFGP